MRRRLNGIAAGLAVLALVAAGCAKSAPSGGGSPTGGASSEPSFATITTGELKIASCLDYQPFESYKGTTLVGFDVDMMDAIAQRLGLKPVWIKANFNTIFTALAANKWDTVAAASTITPEREQIVNFSDPYYNANQSLTANTVKTPDIKNVDQLTSGMIVGVQKGTTGEIWAKANLAPKGIQLKSYVNSPDSFTDLQAGRIQGVINDYTASIGEIAGKPSLAVVQVVVTKEQYGFAVSKDNPTLLAAINGALAKIIADGTYTQIFKKYFPTYPIPPEYAGPGASSSP